MIDTASALFTLTAVCAVLVVGISKSGFGAAFGSLAVPLLALVTTPSHAAALLLPSLLVMDLMGLVVFRRSFDRQLLKLLFPPAMLGIAIGFLTFRQVSAEGLKLILGVVSVLFVLQRWFAPESAPPASRHDATRGRLWGTLSGFTSFIAHAGGPPVSMYLIPKKLDRRVYVGTTALLFAAINFSKWLPYSLLGLFSPSTLKQGALFALAAPLGYWIGLRCLNKLDGVLFYRIINLALLVTGLKLIVDGSMPFLS